MVHPTFSCSFFVALEQNQDIFHDGMKRSYQIYSKTFVWEVLKTTSALRTLSPHPEYLVVFAIVIPRFFQGSSD